MANLGQLVVNLEANIAQFTSDMGRAAQTTEAAARRMSGVLETVRGGVIALGAGATIGAFAVLVKGAIDAADNLRDMSQKTGIAVETLNGLGFAAGQAGGSLESMVAAAGKLNKTIAEAGSGNKEAGEAFKVLGISVRDAEGNLKKADVVTAEIADKFEGFADGPEKSALALRLFGKAGADMIPLLNDGGAAMRENVAYAEQYGGATTALSDASDNFNDTLGKLAVQQKGFVNSMTSAMMPVLQLVADELLGAAEGSNKFSLAGEIARTVLETFVIVGSEVAFTFKAVGTEIGGIAAQLVALAHGDMKGFTAISDAMKADAEKARAEHDEFIKKVLDRTPAAVTADGDKPTKDKPAAPGLPSAASDKVASALLAGQIKAMESAYSQSRDIASFQNSYMADLRAQDLIDVQTYEQFKLDAIASAAAAAAKHYDAEIAALTKARDATSDAAAKAQIGSQISEKVTQKEKARVDAVNQTSLALLSQGAAQADLNKQMQDWARQQDDALAQQKLANDLHNATTVEIIRQTAALRAQLEVEEAIRRAKEQGRISDESIARFKADADAKAKAAAGEGIRGAGLGAIDSLKSPIEREGDEHANQLAVLQAYRDQELTDTIAANQAIERENERHERAMFEMKAAGQQSIVSMMAGASGQLYDVLKQAGMDQTALGKAAFLATKAMAVAQIILNTNVAAAAALAPPPIGLGPVAGLGLAGTIKALGYSSAAMTAGLAIADASAEGGYDIPAGVNPLVQAHEKEMILPKAQAEVIRGLAARGGAGGGGPVIHYSPNFNIDSRSDQQQVRKDMQVIAQQANADLVDRLQRAGRI
jgi:hypothetical protein